MSNEQKIQELLNTGMQIHQQGDLDKALDNYTQALELSPNNNDLLILLGTLFCQKKEFSKSCSYYHKVTKEYGLKNPGYCINYGMALLATGEYYLATDLLQRSIELNPMAFEGHFNLGLCYYKQNNFKKAIFPFQQALRLNPTDIQAQGYLGSSLIETGEHTEGLKILELSFEQTGETPFLRYNIGKAFEYQENYIEALEQYKRTLLLSPDDFSTRIAISRVQAKTGNFAEAEKTAEVITTNEKTDLNLTLLLHLSTIQHMQGNNEKAEKFSRKALEIAPDSAEANGQLALALSNTGRQIQALHFFDMATNSNNTQLMHFINKSKNYASLGMIEEAIQTAQEAFSRNNHSAEAFSNFLLYLNYLSNISEDIIINLHRQYGDVFSNNQPLTNNYSIQTDKIQIGFISGDFCNHPIQYFLLPVLQKIQRDNEINLIIFSNNTLNDQITAKIQKYANEWHNIRFMNDHQAYALIASKNLDLLIDLSGHTNNNRLPLLAMKPCRQQMSYLGYPNTTGLKEMDYRLTDKFADSPERATNYSEKLCYMNNSFLIYDPPENIPDITYTPKKSINFGSFNNIAKISNETLKMWAIILHNVPESKLTLKCNGIDKESLENILIPKFATYNITAERLILLGRNSNFSEHLREYSKIDIALDTFPYNGTTTTFEAILMGCPVITRSTGTHVSSVGKSILTNLQTPELITNSFEEYITTAVNLSFNSEILTEYHASLPKKLLESPLCDSDLFYKNFIAVLKEINIII